MPNETQTTVAKARVPTRAAVPTGGKEIWRSVDLIAYVDNADTWTNEQKAQTMAMSAELAQKCPVGSPSPEIST